MDPKTAQIAVREKGLCGRLLDKESRVCIQELGHDNGLHDTGWKIKTVEHEPEGRGERSRGWCLYVVTDGSRRAFETEDRADAADADWLVTVLNKVEQ
jgi:hypothetical protein